MSLFKKKAAPETQEPMDLDAVMKKFDRESNTRVWEGIPKILVTCVLAAFSVFCIYVTLFSNALPEVRLSLFVGLILVMGFLNFPARKNHVKVNSMPWYDIIIMVLGSGATRMTARELLRELRQMRQAGFDEHASPRIMNRSPLAARLPKDVQEALERLRRGQ